MNFTWGQNIVFGFLNVHLLSPGGFFTFLIALAHGAAGRHNVAKWPPSATTPWTQTLACAVAYQFWQLFQIGM